MVSAYGTKQALPHTGKEWKQRRYKTSILRCWYQARINWAGCERMDVWHKISRGHYLSAHLQCVVPVVPYQPVDMRTGSAQGGMVSSGRNKNVMKIENNRLFWCQLTWVVREKRP